MQQDRRLPGAAAGSARAASPVFASIAITWLPGVATNITPLLTIGAASWPLVTPVANTQTGCSRADVAGRDLVQRAVAPAVVGAPDHQPVAVLGLLQPLGGHRLVVLQDRRNRRSLASPVAPSRARWSTQARARQRRPRRKEFSCAFLAFHSSDVLRVQRSTGLQRRPYVRGISARRLALRRDRYAVSKPTRLVNGFATTSRPSTIASGSAGNGRGAGPSTTRAPSLGLNFEK